MPIGLLMESSGEQTICQIILLSPTTGVTSASCIKTGSGKYTSGHYKLVVGGRENTFLGDAAGFDIEDAVLHPDYDEDTFANNIAVVTFSSTLSSDYNYRVASRPSEFGSFYFVQRSLVEDLSAWNNHALVQDSVSYNDECGDASALFKANQDDYVCNYKMRPSFFADYKCSVSYRYLMGVEGDSAMVAGFYSHSSVPSDQTICNSVTHYNFYILLGNYVSWINSVLGTEVQAYTKDGSPANVPSDDTYSVDMELEYTSSEVQPYSLRGHVKLVEGVKGEPEAPETGADNNGGDPKDDSKGGDSKGGSPNEVVSYTTKTKTKTKTEYGSTRWRTQTNTVDETMTENEDHVVTEESMIEDIEETTQVETEQSTTTMYSTIFQEVPTTLFDIGTAIITLPGSLTVTVANGMECPKVASCGTFSTPDDSTTTETSTEYSYIPGVTTTLSSTTSTSDPQPEEDEDTEVEIPLSSYAILTVSLENLTLTETVPWTTLTKTVTITAIETPTEPVPPGTPTTEETTEDTTVLTETSSGSTTTDQVTTDEPTLDEEPGSDGSQDDTTEDSGGLPIGVIVGIVAGLVIALLGLGYLYYRWRKEQTICGVVLVSESIGVTSATCFEYDDNLNVNKGKYNMLVGWSEDTNLAHTLAIGSVTIHPEFDPSTFANNIAILKNQTLKNQTLKTQTPKKASRITKSHLTKYTTTTTTTTMPESTRETWVDETNKVWTTVISTQTTTVPVTTTSTITDFTTTTELHSTTVISTSFIDAPTTLSGTETQYTIDPGTTTISLPEGSMCPAYLTCMAAIESPQTIVLTEVYTETTADMDITSTVLGSGDEEEVEDDTTTDDPPLEDTADDEEDPGSFSVDLVTVAETTVTKTVAESSTTDLVVVTLTETLPITNTDAVSEGEASSEQQGTEESTETTSSTVESLDSTGEETTEGGDSEPADEADGAGSDEQDDKDSNDGPSLGLIIGIVAGAVVILSIIGYLIYRRWKKQAAENNTTTAMQVQDQDGSHYSYATTAQYTTAPESAYYGAYTQTGPSSAYNTRPQTYGTDWTRRDTRR
ncbi:hypothetical protein GGF46_001496 [Coemansia sp. RSA 552]|nr:hypothetical protein GGF46_001496 [Coemansia sp. RSA 552]